MCNDDVDKVFKIKKPRKQRYKKEGSIKVKKYNTFFAYLDFLGFSNKINSSENISEFVEKIFGCINKAVQKSSTIGSNKLRLDYFMNLRILSDSILIWAEEQDSYDRNFESLFFCLVELFHIAFEEKIPLRGVLNYGDLICCEPINDEKLFSSVESLYGKSLIKSIELEKGQEWSGCFVTNSVLEKLIEIANKCKNNKLNIIEDYFYKPKFIFVDIPIKEKYRVKFAKDIDNGKGVVLNWNYNYFFDAIQSEQKLEEKDIKNAFINDGQIDIKIEEKQKNTLDFFEMTKGIMDKLRARDTSEIPLPKMLQ